MRVEQHRTWEGHGRPLGLAVGSGATAGALVVAQAALLARAVDAAFLGGAGLPAIRPLLVGLAAVALARAAAAWGQEVAAQRFSADVRLGIRDRLTRQLLARGPRHAAQERSGELANTLVGGVEALDAYLSQYLPQAWLAGLVPLLVLVAVLRADPLSAAVLAVTFPLIPLFTGLIGSKAHERTSRQWVTLSRLSATFLDALQGLPTLRAFGREAAQAGAIEEASERYRRLTMNVLRLAFLSALVLELLATMGTAIVAVELGLRLLRARVAFGDALFVLLLTPEFYRPLRALGASFHASMTGGEAARRIDALLASPGRLAAPQVLTGSGDEGGLPSGRGATAGGPPAIVFEGVRFAYGRERGPVLDGLDLRLEAGTTLALIGPSGAGKTTAAHLLMRFLEPDSGVVLVDGSALSAERPEEWRRRVAYVPQRPRLFHGSILDNVRMARPEAAMTEIETAARLAGAEGFIREAPGGWDSPVGEGGEQLSGGQVQRLALARAFLRNAPVLVLDEPTAQLDPEHEVLVTEAIGRLRHGRTVLLIAHRLATARSADRIAVLSRGRVVEEGSHLDLMSRGRVYPRLVAAWGGAA